MLILCSLSIELGGTNEGHSVSDTDAKMIYLSIKYLVFERREQRLWVCDPELPKRNKKNPLGSNSWHYDAVQCDWRRPGHRWWGARGEEVSWQSDGGKREHCKVTKKKRRACLSDWSRRGPEIKELEMQSLVMCAWIDWAPDWTLA